MKGLDNSENRLMLFNQYKILSLLDEDNASSYGYYMDILIEGIRKKYSVLLEPIGIDSSEISIEISDEVDLIIEIFKKVQSSVSRMDARTQEELREGYYINFDDFDCRSVMERPHYTYCRFLKNHKEVVFPDEGNDNFRLSLQHYRRMIDEYQAHRYAYDLTPEQIRKICVCKGEEMDIFKPSFLDVTTPITPDPLCLVKEDKLYQQE